MLGLHVGKCLRQALIALIGGAIDGQAAAASGVNCMRSCCLQLFVAAAGCCCFLLHACVLQQKVQTSDECPCYAI